MLLIVFSTHKTGQSADDRTQHTRQFIYIFYGFIFIYTQ